MMIQSLDSKLYLKKASHVIGWSEFSIVRKFGDEDSSSWVEQYADDTTISQEGSQVPAANLVVSNSHAVVNLADNLITRDILGEQLLDICECSVSRQDCSCARADDKLETRDICLKDEHNDIRAHDIAWAPDNEYCARIIQGCFGDEIRVYSVNEIGQEHHENSDNISLVAHVRARDNVYVDSIEWDADGQYLGVACGHAEPEFVVYFFDRATETLKYNPDVRSFIKMIEAGDAS